MLSLALIALAVVALTWLVGWWGVVIAGVVAGAMLWRRRGVSWLVALAAIVGWSTLIVVDSARGRFAALASSLGGVMGVPAPLLIAVTLLFAALLAWSAAVLGSEIARTARGEK
jgi:hypothetical protein